MVIQIPQKPPNKMYARRFVLPSTAHVLTASVNSAKQVVTEYAVEAK